MEQEDETRRVLCYKERGRQVRAGHDTAIRCLELRFSSRGCRGREEGDGISLDDAISGIYPRAPSSGVSISGILAADRSRKKGGPSERTYACMRT